MSGLFGGSQPVQTPNYTGLQIQTAVNTLPIPIVWGEAKVAPNVVWYNNFQISNGGKNAGGKGGLFGDQETTYTAAVIMALCEGPVINVNQIWKNQSVYSLGQLQLSLFTGTTPQSPWSYVTTAYPAQALGYQGTAYVCASDYNLGDSATLDNHDFEIQGVFYASGFNGLDADPAEVINDFLTNAQYGAGFPAASIDADTLFSSGGQASYQNYCLANGFCLSPALTDQEPASSILERWLKLTNTAAVWSGGQLRLIPYGDTAVTAGTVASITSLRQIGEVASGSSNPAPITVCNAPYFVADQGVTYANTGAALSYTGASYPTSAGTYGMNPVGTYLFAEADEGTNVEISYQYKTAASYTPNVAPIYNLDDDDFAHDDDEDPLQVSRSDPFAAYNVYRLEVADRGNAYNLTMVEARDQNAIEVLSLGAGGVGTFQGMRVAPTVTAHEICDTNVGLLSAQLMLQRSVYIRNTYKFRLSWECCLLDPMDLVTVTDPVLGLDNAPIRITEIEEDGNGLLEVTAEEFPLGVASATLYKTQTVTNNPLNRAKLADPVNPPIVFEPPAALVGATPQVWIAASGGAGGVADPNWGGANVWMSTDGTSYALVGAINGPARQGLLSAPLPSYSGTNPDQAHTLAVNMAESGGVLATATDLDAQLASTLCIVDSELVSYATATLTAASNYALTYLFRGLFGTAVAAHATGAQFAFLNTTSVFEYDLPAQYIGQTLYIKLQSFNVFGAGVQSLASCTAYTYTPTGGAFAHPAAEEMLTSTSLDFGSVTLAPGVRDDFGSVTLSPVLDVDLAAA